MDEASDDAGRKYGLAFLLNGDLSPSTAVAASAIVDSQSLVSTASPGLDSASASVGATALKPPRRKGRTCKAEGCDNYIVHKGLCCRHGGGKKCSVEGCEATAKHSGRCWKHGGSVECKVPGCSRKAKAKGLCWGHGGGVKCAAEDCSKVAISNGSCWAHGGGKRCIHDGCQKPAYERTHSFCIKHYNELQGADYYEL